LICAAVTLALVLFFKAQTIVVDGEENYTEEQIVEASGIRQGDNLYLLNKFNAAEEITRQLSYVEKVQIRRLLPSTLIITVKECTAPAAVAQEGKLWLISGSGKIVDTASTANAQKYTQILGITLSDPRIGELMTVTEESASVYEEFLALLSCMQERDMLGDTGSISLQSTEYIALSYLERFTVLVPYGADLDYKLDYLLSVVDRLEANETGTIDLTQDGTASFIPSTHTAAQPEATASDISEATPGDIPSVSQ